MTLAIVLVQRAARGPQHEQVSRAVVVEVRADDADADRAGWRRVQPASVRRVGPPARVAPEQPLHAGSDDDEFERPVTVDVRKRLSATETRRRRARTGSVEFRGLEAAAE